ncbi:hypothetical protein [Butyrivibrio fibrisolvens]|nr:hypothetical protein [Butyrivibrio fibrisolvens]
MKSIPDPMRVFYGLAQKDANNELMTDKKAKEILKNILLLLK